MLTDSDRAIIQEFKDGLDERGVRFHEIIAYGSRARGDATSESDLDLLVVVEDKSPETRDAIENCAWQVGFDREIYIQPVIKRRKDIEEGPEYESLFMIAIREDGVRV